MLKRNLILLTLLVLALLALAACSTPALGVIDSARAAAQAGAAVPPTSTELPAAAAAPATPTSLPAAPTSAPVTAGLSSAQVKAIQTIIQQANQEQVQALAANNPAIMQDTATTTYYQQSVQTLNNLIQSGVSAIQLVNLNWGPITLQNGTSAQATTYETWSTTFSDGSTLKETDKNVYTVVLESGAWKVQDDQHPSSAALQPVSSPAPVGPVAPAQGTGSQSRNWSGYNATGGTFTAVSGSWTVPNVSAATTGVDATWVGIGGVNTTDLIQAGTQATVQNGQVVYTAWWETLPQVVQDVPMTVAAGDQISVSITEPSSGNWLVVINDATNQQTWQKSLTYRSSLSSAEWVEEAPSAGRRTLLPLDQFGSVTFTAATTVENGKTRTIAQTGATPIMMNNGAGQILAQTSVLGPTGDSFTVTRTSVPAPSPFRGRGG